MTPERMPPYTTLVDKADYDILMQENERMRARLAEVTRERDDAEANLESLQKRYAQVTEENGQLAERLADAVELIDAIDLATVGDPWAGSSIRDDIRRFAARAADSAAADGGGEET